MDMDILDLFLYVAKGTSCLSAGPLHRVRYSFQETSFLMWPHLFVSVFFHGLHFRQRVFNCKKEYNDAKEISIWTLVSIF